MIAKGTASGPDILVGFLSDAKLWGQSGGIAGYSFGTTACNAGDQTVAWQGQTREHPVVSQALYRLKDGRFEQIGMGWLKHGFLALAENACGFGCQDPGSFTELGVGCSDPYGANLNGDQTRLGPRSELNASTGFFPFPYSGQNQTGNAIFKRVQVAVADITPGANAGARYFAEGQYVSAADAAAGNDLNNASYREVTFDAGLTPTLIGATQRGKAALEAWRQADPAVAITDLDLPGDGRFKLASRVSQQGNGFWRYEYALYNQSSHRSARRFRVPLPPGTQVSNASFHDLDYHSGEVYDGTDWPVTVSADAVTWETQAESENAQANALRFGTTYNFWFDADRPPVPASVEIGLFRAGSPAAATISTQGPGEGSALTLRNGRFVVAASFETAAGLAGSAHAVELTDDSGFFWFFNPANVEMVVKVLNGCPVNGRFWVFAAGLTNVEVTMTVTDTETGQTRTYSNPLSQPFQPIQDTGAFSTCP